MNSLELWLGILARHIGLGQDIKLVPHQHTEAAQVNTQTISAISKTKYGDTK